MIEEENFAQAIDLPPEERDAFLLNAHGDDEGLRESVEELLSAHEFESVIVDAPHEEAAKSGALPPKTRAFLGVLRSDPQPAPDETEHSEYLERKYS